MNARLQFHSPLCLFVLTVALGLFGCTKTVTETVILPCSNTNPTGACDSGQSCFEGACVATATLCSPTNLTGECPTGRTCFSGGCVVGSTLCSVANPQGPCLTGSTCFEGGCEPTASLCSLSNLTGKCPSGQACDQGVCAGAGQLPCTMHVYNTQPVLGLDTRSKLTVDGLEFKDLNGDGTLTPYEDWRLLEICRARNLVTLMDVPQLVGLLGEASSIGSGTQDGTIPTSAENVIKNEHRRQALIRLGSRTASELAVYLNNVQKMCEAEPLGIPFVVTTDPSHGMGMSTSGTSGNQSLSASNVVSPWPYPLGLGAINDLDVTRQYGDTVRKEFMAMGFRWQLGPMADLGTEPRWARVQNVFGENAYHVANHVRACVSGFQDVGGQGLKNGIAATMKHFPGAGANEDGKDSHSRPGKYNVYPGGTFTYHQIPFQAAIDVGVAAVMPCYSIFKGQVDYDPEQVGASFSYGLITEYLKKTMGFSGMVTSDWGTMTGTPWGVEMLTQPERAARFIKAGSNQLGNDSVSIIQAAYDEGLLTREDLEGAAAKVLEMSFKLGLFENPYVDEAAAATIVRSQENLRNGFNAQKKALVILKNRAHEAPPPSGFGGDQATKYLPIDGARYRDANSNGAPDVGEYIDDSNGNGVVEVYFDGVNDGLAGSDIYDSFLDTYAYTSAGNGTKLGVVQANTPDTADLAVLRITARKGTYFGLDDGVPLSFDAPFPGIQTDSSLGSSTKDRNKIIDLLRIRDGYKNSTGTTIAPVNPKLRIVLVMHMDRPSIVKPFINGLVSLDETPGEPGSYPMVSNEANIRADALGGVDGFLVEFGAYDRAVLDVLFNQHLPTTPAGYVYGQSRLPMEIPSSDAEVNAQFEDLSADTWNPTFALGSGMTW